MSDVFISYKSSDKERVRILVEALEQQGWSVWWDPEIPPGKTWDEIIEEALDNAKCVIVVWSKDSVKSDWVKEEADKGKRRGILVPVLIDDVKIPLGFGRIQAAWLVDWQGSLLDQGFNQLLEAVAGILSHPQVHEQAELLEEENKEQKVREEAAKEQSEKTPEVELKRKAEKRKLKLISTWIYGTVGGLIVLVVIIIGLLKWYNLQQESPSDSIRAQQAFKKGKELFEAKNYSSALPLLQQAAEAGYDEAMLNIGYIYEQGLGVKVDYGKALDWYRMGVKVGNARAMVKLGYMHENGFGVKRDYGEAVHWYRKGAEADDALAMNNLGYMYENGLGVEKNHDEAVRWYTKAASLGNEYAKSALKRLEEVEVVIAPPQVLDFVAKPPTIKKGETSTLRWKTLNAEEAYINKERVRPSGSKTVSPGINTTYTLIARNEEGKTAKGEITVEVTTPSPEILDIHIPGYAITLTLRNGIYYCSNGVPVCPWATGCCALPPELRGKYHN